MDEGGGGGAKGGEGGEISRAAVSLVPHHQFSTTNMKLGLTEKEYVCVWFVYACARRAEGGEG